MKKIILFSIFFLFFGLAPHVFAEGFVPLAGIPGLTQGATADTAGVANFFNNLYKFAIGMASVLAIIMIIWGGLQYATQDIPGAKQEGKDRILQAILGLILVLSPALVFSIINPNILNLSINLKPLDTKSGAYTAPSTVLPPCGNGRRTDCTPVAPKKEGVSDIPTVGQYCYMRVDPTKADSSAEYVCASTQMLCDNLYGEQIKNDGSNKFVGSSCRLR